MGIIMPVNPELYEIIVKATSSFIILLILTRLMGRKQLSQLTFFNYITGITLGSIAANITIGNNISFLNGLTSLVWWSFLTILVGYLGLKLPRGRIVTDGQPVIVIQQGKILEDELKKLRLNMDDLRMLLREKNVFSTSDVEHAVFETNGKLSIMLRKSKQPLTKLDQHTVSFQSRFIPTELVVDGVIINKNLKEAGLTKAWLQQQLKAMGIDFNNIFYIELQEDGTLYVDLSQDNIRE